jgi:hypothetical protein
MAAQAIIKSLPAEFTLSNTDYISKRPRIDDNSNQNSSASEGYQNSDGLETSVSYEDPQYAGHKPNVDSTSSLKSKSIVSVETLENLKILSQGLNMTNYDEIKETKTEALTGLAEYGSDDDNKESEEERSSTENR